MPDWLSDIFPQIITSLTVFASAFGGVVAGSKLKEYKLNTVFEHQQGCKLHEDILGIQKDVEYIKKAVDEHTGQLREIQRQPINYERT